MFVAGRRNAGIGCGGWTMLISWFALLAHVFSSRQYGAGDAVSIRDRDPSRGSVWRPSGARHSEPLIHRRCVTRKPQNVSVETQWEKAAVYNSSDSAALMYLAVGQRPPMAAQACVEGEPDDDGGQRDSEIRAKEQQPRRIGDQGQIEDIEQ